MAVRDYRFSRRSLLATAMGASCAFASGAKGQKGQMFEAEVERYPDPATEFQVYRLTGPSYTSILPGRYNRVISRNSGMLLYCSDRAGSPQAFRLDLKTADSQQLTASEDLEGNSLTLLPDNRSFCFFAGHTLYVASLGSLRERPVYTPAEGWELMSAPQATPDGARVLLVERKAGASRLRSVALAQGAAHTILEAPFEIADPIERPQHAQISYRQPARGVWLAGTDGKGNAELKLAAGGIGPAFWSQDGNTLLYLNFPEEPGQLNSIREYSPESRTDKLVAKTSQYVTFAPNRDGTVYVGASRNAASPAILIMLRSVRRELTLCEHRASHADQVSPMFSPDAQRIYFQSDRHGKPAIYSLHVERLVERIDEAG
jgi:oligogalacturonide lyase